jgi:two-component system phosphate regulon response regulator PhoB
VQRETAVILLIEGNSNNHSFAPALEKAGYETAVFHTGINALNWAAQNHPDLIVFDSSSMRSSGSRSCRRLRRDLADLPIIHCRAQGTEEDKSAGADVYLSLPFTPRKLLNRIRALLPADVSKEEVVRCGHITLYRSKRSVDVNGQGERSLTPKLAQLLEEFIRHPNELVTRRQLMLNVWKTEYIGDTRTLDVHIRWVREQIEENPTKPQLLRTIRGKGYIFIMPSAETK